MADGVTLFIGPQALAHALGSLPGAAGTDLVVYPEDQIREAVAHIVRERPRIVALPEKFAVSPRGTALTHRLAIDAQLADTRVIVIDSTGAAVEAPRTGYATWLPTDASGTRRVPRILMREGVDAQIDGATVSLVNLSTLGAQVLSPLVLRPRQRVRIVLAVAPSPVKAAGTVVWASFEIPKSGQPPQYRAGLEFQETDPEPLLQFCLEQAAEAAS